MTNDSYAEEDFSLEISSTPIRKEHVRHETGCCKSNQNVNAGPEGLFRKDTTEMAGCHEIKWDGINITESAGVRVGGDLDPPDMEMGRELGSWGI